MRPSIPGRLPTRDKTYLTWEFQEICSSNTTPKYLNLQTRLIGRPLNTTLKFASESLAWVPNNKASVLTVF